MYRSKPQNLKHSRKAWQLRLISLAITLALLYPIPTQAQERLSWSEPLLLNDTGGVTPFIISDVSGCVHVFWGAREPEDECGAIFYRVLRNGDWSGATDIIAAPNQEDAILPRAVIDDQGFFHLVWTSLQGVYYSKAPVVRAQSPRAWSHPVRLSAAQATSPDICLDDAGTLNVVYAETVISRCVRYTHSTDGGESWSTPVAISNPRGGAYAMDAALACDRTGTIHAIWSEAIQAWPPTGVYYTQSRDNGKSWREPQTMAAGGYSCSTISIDGQNQVHLFWTGTGEWGGKYHTWSPDGGDSWAPIERVLHGTMGMLGPAGMAVDSSGTLYVVSGAAGPYFSQIPKSSGEILLAAWLNNQWSEPMHISDRMQDVRRENNSPKITISLGNSAHVVWAMQGPRLDIWYSSSQLHTPALPPGKVPIPNSALPSPTPRATATSTRNRYIPSIEAEMAPRTGQANISFLFLGIVPPIAFLLVMVLWKTRNKWNE